MLAFTGTTWIQWTPRPGLDPTLSETVLNLGAMMYAKALQKGFTTEKAHEFAEREMYKRVYGIIYHEETS